MTTPSSPQPGTVWCAERLNTTGDDLSLATLFSLPDERAAVHAISALYIEFEQIIAETLDLNVARLKLAWWREEIQRLAEGNSEHPMTLLLSRNSPVPSITNLLDLITGAELRLLQGQPSDLSAARLAGERVGPPLVKAFASLRGESPNWAAELGKAIALNRYMPRIAQQNERAEASNEVLTLIANHTPEVNSPGFSEALRVLVSLAWNQSSETRRRRKVKLAPRSRVIVSWRAARGHMPHNLIKRHH